MATSFCQRIIENTVFIILPDVASGEVATRAMGDAKLRKAPGKEYISVTYVEYALHVGTGAKSGWCRWNAILM